MTTTTSTHTIQRNDLVKRAYRRCGIDYPTPTRINLAVDLLNDILKEIDSEGRWLWTINPTPSTFMTIPNQRSYGTLIAGETVGSAIDPNMLRLEWAEVVQGTSLRPLRIIYEMEALNNIQREATNGEPYFAFLQPDAVMTNQRLHLFPTPSAPKQINYTFRRRLYDFLAPNDNPDFPQDWTNRLVTRLTAELAPELGLPLDEQTLREQLSEKKMEEGKAANVEKASPFPRRTQFF